jgi:hypothetical protein
MCDVKDQSCIPCYLQPLLSFLSSVHPYLVSFSVYFYASPAPGNYLVLSMPTLHPTHHPRKKGGGGAFTAGATLPSGLCWGAELLVASL